MSVFKNQAKKAAHSQRVPLVSNVTIHSIHYSSILAHGPGTPFTLQEYFGFLICKSSHPDFHVSFERLHNFEKRFIASGHPKLSYMYFSI